MDKPIQTQCARCADPLEFVSLEEYNAYAGADDAPGVLCLSCRPKVVVEDVS